MASQREVKRTHRKLSDTLCDATPYGYEAAVGLRRHRMPLLLDGLEVLDEEL
jgi:hypothetical protein